jgi:NADPH:quinone reductase-like Zn-dependent oxidoreductase
MSENNIKQLKTWALRYERHGAPAEVLAPVALDVPALRAGEALVALRAGAIHYSDLGLINGTYGKARELPAIAGREGVGEVVALAPGVSSPALGALVRMPEEAGVWREAVVANAAELFPIPPGVPPEQAAMAFINPPTAWRMLHDFVELKPGDWLIQNAGTSAVGILIAQLSRHLGFKCVSVVRDAASAGHLREAGAAVVVAEDSGYEKNPAKLTGGAPIKLALNAVGGESVGRLCRAVANGGIVVTYGGVTAEPMRFPTRNLIFNDISLRGFWHDRWIHTQPPTVVRALTEKIFNLMREGIITQPVAARYALADWRTALEHAFRAGKGGKVIFTSNWRP